MTAPRHIHNLRAKPASEAKRLPVPANHPALQEPFPVPVWVCKCGYEFWAYPEWRNR
jgi:hypothetical protein